MSEDLTKKLTKRDSEKLDLIITAVQALTSKTTSLEGNFALMQLRFDTIDSQVQALDNKVEERLYDTRPIWEQVVANVALLQEGQQQVVANVALLQESQQQVVANVAQLQEGQQQVVANVALLQEGQQQVVANVALLQEGQQRIEKTLEDSRNESRESRTVLRDILRRMSIFNDTLVTIQADYRDIYDRVRHLELRNS